MSQSLRLSFMAIYTELQIPKADNTPNMLSVAKEPAFFPLFAL